MILSIDFGTTKIAVVLYDTEKNDTLFVQSAPHQAALSLPPGQSELDTAQLDRCLQDLLISLPEELLPEIQAVALTGQMHSIVFWNKDFASPVVTWQDHRASVAGTLQRFRQLSGLPLADGFGGTTLAHFALEKQLGAWKCCADVAGYFAWKMTGAPVVMDPTFAASWGLYGQATQNWNQNALKSLAIPLSLLPQIVSSGTVFGQTNGFANLPDGIPVLAPIGDNQASVLGSVENTTEELFLTLGTGGQLSAVLTPEERSRYAFSPEVEFRPFLNGSMLAVYAPLCGGSAWAWLARSINCLLADLGLPQFPEHELMDQMDLMAEENSDLIVHPDFLGRRSDPACRGSISGLSLNNFTLGRLAGALGEGMIRDLFAPFPKELLSTRKKVAVSGNCIRKCHSIQRAAQKISGLPLRICNLREEAAVGAAKLASHALNTPS